MSDPLSITAADSGGTTYEVSVSPVDDDEATLSVTDWAPGESPDVYDSTNHNEYELTGVKISGDTITCQTTSIFGTPEITITLADASVTISVSHILFAPSPITLPLDAKTVAQARAWLAAQNFPST